MTALRRVSGLPPASGSGGQFAGGQHDAHLQRDGESDRRRIIVRHTESCASK